MNIEREKKAMIKNIDAVNFCLPFFDHAAKVVKDFDGKVYNVKFRRALQEKIIEYDNHKKFCINEKFCLLNVYVDSICPNLSKIIIVDSEGMPYEDNFIKSEIGKQDRINASRFLQEIEVRKNNYLKMIDDLNEDLSQIDDIIAKILEYEKMKREEKDKIKSFETKNIFDDILTRPYLYF